MAYQRKATVTDIGNGLLSIEQERRRKAELARTVHALRLETLRLEHEAEQVKSVLTALRETVGSTRQETSRMSAYIQKMRQLPAPRYGGRDGLLAAVAEIEAHELSKDKPRKERPVAAHGSKRRYYVWDCRCEKCVAWRDDQRAKLSARYYARKEQKAAA